MGTTTENKCYRCRQDCMPLSNISGGEKAESFICVGYNQKCDRSVDADRFTLCWKNDVVDERGHWDRRDLLDTQSVIAQALSIDENIRVGEKLTDDEMNDVEFLK